MDLPSFPAPATCQSRYHKGRLALTASTDALDPSLRAPRGVGLWAGVPFVVATVTEHEERGEWSVIATQTDVPRAHLVAALGATDRALALEHLRHAQSLPGAPLEVFQQEALFLLEVDPEGAAKAMQRGLEAVEDLHTGPAPRHVGALRLLVAALVALDRGAEAEPVLEQALEARPDHPELRRMHALAQGLRLRREAEERAPDGPIEIG